MLGQCGQAPRDLASYHQRKRDILESINSRPDIGTDDQILYADLMFQVCEDVTDEVINSKDTWYDLAIENGSDMARQNYAASLLSTDMLEAGKQYKMLWDNGFTHGGYGLSQIYGLTDFDGNDPSKPNLVKAYAYQLAQDMVNIAALNASSRHDASMFLTGIQDAQNIASASLSLQEQQEAEDLSRQLLIDNSKCCVLIWGR